MPWRLAPALGGPAFCESVIALGRGWLLLWPVAPPLGCLYLTATLTPLLPR